MSILLGKKHVISIVDVPLRIKTRLRHPGNDTINHIDKLHSPIIHTHETVSPRLLARELLE